MFSLRRRSTYPQIGQESPKKAGWIGSWPSQRARGTGERQGTKAFRVSTRERLGVPAEPSESPHEPLVRVGWTRWGGKRRPAATLAPAARGSTVGGKNRIRPPTQQGNADTPSPGHGPVVADSDQGRKAASAVIMSPGARPSTRCSLRLVKTGSVFELRRYRGEPSLSGLATSSAVSLLLTVLNQ